MIRKKNKIILILMGLIIGFCGVMIYVNSNLEKTINIFFANFCIFIALGFLGVYMYIIYTHEEVYYEDDEEDLLDDVMPFSQRKEEELTSKLEEIDRLLKNGLITETEYQQRKIRIYDFYT